MTPPPAYRLPGGGFLDLAWATAALEQYGLVGIFAVVALEYACFPLPSEAVLPLSGMAAAAAGLPLPLVVFVTVLAGLVGSTVCYLLGALGGRPLMEKLLKRFPRALSTLDRTSDWQRSMGGLSVMLARVIPVFRTWISFAAGLGGQPLGAFLLYSSMGIIVWNTLLLLSGYYLFMAGLMAQVQQYLWLVPIAVTGTTVAVTFIKRRKRAKGEAAAL